jgi:cell division protein FtsW (lipid II flippase)
MGLSMLYFLIIFPWIIFTFIAEYSNFKDDKINKKRAIIKNALILIIFLIIGIIMIYLPEEYNRYFSYLFMIVSSVYNLVATYLNRKKNKK